MNLPTFRWLLSPEGQRALAIAADLPLTDASHLADLERLRRSYAPDQAAAVLETVRLRRRAAIKFALAERMYFTREALEQATSESVAAHMAARFAPYGTVADLCCGIGGDAIALARVARVIAVDRDPLRVAMARANLAAHGLADRGRFICADVTRLPLPPLDAIYVDPARRTAERRHFTLAAYQPAFATILDWTHHVAATGVKVAPGIADDEVPPGCEVEFVALGDDLKVALLWFGALRTAGRRATLLPSGLTLASPVGSRHEISLPITHHPSLVRSPAGYLYEPNPAIIRAHLLADLARQIGGSPIDPTIAYLCAPALIATPLARAYRVDEWFPFNLKGLNRRLRELTVGRVVVKKRGSPLDPQDLERRLRLDGPHQRVVVLTRVAGQPAIILCHPTDSAEGGDPHA
jgi:hypothetical protein